jgi:hypothetical protein
MSRLIAILLVLLPLAASAQPQVIPGPPGSERFGAGVRWLPNGNLVVVDPNFDREDGTANVGAVWIYRPDGTLLSRLTGAAANDNLGSAETVGPIGVPIVGGSNIVVRSFNFAAGAGSVTWIDGDVGLDGVISASNSLVGGSPGDRIGVTGGESGITVLPNGDYVVQTPTWDGPGAVDAGAVTHCSGATGCVGVVSAANSLVGSRAQDYVGNDLVVLANGSYVVWSTRWDRDIGGDVLVNAGAVTWRAASNPAVGPVTDANSLTTTNRFAPSTSNATAITPLSNGNYVVSIVSWDDDVSGDADLGSVTWRPGNASAPLVVGPTNSLIGAAANDQLGNTVTALADGNYVVTSRNFQQSRGLVRWMSGTAPAVGIIPASGSLVGSQPSELLGNGGVLGLPNGAYLVLSRAWDRDGVDSVGALTYGPAGVGVSGTITPANSLVGVRTGDINGETLSRITVLTNGNYVYAAEGWDNGTAMDAGAAVWGHRDTGVVGEISAANALVGSTTFDQVGSTSFIPGRSGVIALSNGHYVVSSGGWDNGATTNVGAATWGNGETGTVGVIGPANSLIGAAAGAGVGPAIALTNGHYVVRSGNSVSGFGSLGAVTWCDGTGPTSALMTAANSLVGTRFNDNVGSRIVALANGHYAVTSWDWNDATRTRVGAVTWGNGNGGTVGTLGPGNSLLGGRTDDRIGRTDLSLVGPGAVALPDGHYVVASQYLVVGQVRGGVTLARGSGGTVGALDAVNTALGGYETSGNFTVRVAYDVPSATLAVGQSANNRVMLLRLADAGLFADGFE